MLLSIRTVPLAAALATTLVCTIATIRRVRRGVAAHVSVAPAVAAVGAVAPAVGATVAATVGIVAAHGHAVAAISASVEVTAVSALAAGTWRIVLAASAGALPAASTAAATTATASSLGPRLRHRALRRGPLDIDPLVVYPVVRGLLDNLVDGVRVVVCHKAKATRFPGLAVLHYDDIGDIPKLLKICGECLLRAIPGEAADKDLI
mmetsp:Transcript_74775/g.222962  ORF Transcript_74775/g.222962 Transcript_74775/m.222962 type:complete len:206 (+) Transcript_74775:213-830(+)